MNCFQKLLSSWRGTTKTPNLCSACPLWIAFKNYYLRDEEQLTANDVKNLVGCELLSKIIIFVTRNNNHKFSHLLGGVVNCFQKLLSSWRGTTLEVLMKMFSVLWIAFKNYYLRDEEQRLGISGDVVERCELLSKIIIFVTRNNQKRQPATKSTVVNCFQKLLSSWRGTTIRVKVLIAVMLWIAFKNYYLRDEEQQQGDRIVVMDGCELLSKIIIFVTRNNINLFWLKALCVVNCFQKLLSSWRGTTRNEFTLLPI